MYSQIFASSLLFAEAVDVYSFAVALASLGMSWRECFPNFGKGWFMFIQQILKSLARVAAVVLFSDEYVRSSRGHRPLWGMGLIVKSKYMLNGRLTLHTLVAFEWWAMQACLRASVLNRWMFCIDRTPTEQRSQRQHNANACGRFVMLLIRCGSPTASARGRVFAEAHGGGGPGWGLARDVRMSVRKPFNASRTAVRCSWNF